MRSRRSGAVRPGDAPPQPEFNGMPHVGASRFFVYGCAWGCTIRHGCAAVEDVRFPLSFSAPGFRAWFPRLVSAAGFRRRFLHAVFRCCFLLLLPAAVFPHVRLFRRDRSVSPHAPHGLRAPQCSVRHKKRAYPSNGYARMAVCGRSGITPRLPRTGPCQRRKAGKPNPREYLRMPCRGRCHLRGRRLQGHKSNRIRCNDTFSSFFDFLKGL